MDNDMESTTNEELKDNKALNSEVVKLRDVLTTVTEALILFQEFLETEVGEITYFRDSGCQQKLVQVMDYLRSSIKSNIVVKKEKVEVVDLEQTGSSVPTAAVAAPGETSEQISNSDVVKVEVDKDLYEDGEPNIRISGVYGTTPIEDANNNANTPKRSKLDMNGTDGIQSKILLKQDTNPNPMGVTVPFQSVPAAVSRPSYPPIPITFTAVTVAERQQQVISVNRLGQEKDAAQTSLLASSSSPTSAISILADVALTKEPLKLYENSYAKVAISGKDKKVKEKKDKCTNEIEKLRRGRRSSKKTEDGSPPSGSVKCPVCLKLYSSKGVMSRHVKESHSIEPQFTCFYCALRFRNGPARLEHMNAQHPNEMKSVICPYCNRNTKTITAKRNHVMLCQKLIVTAEDEDQNPKRGSRRGRKRAQNEQFHSNLA